MTKEQYDKECKELGIICTDAFEGKGFDPDIADNVISAMKETLSSLDLDAIAKKMDDIDKFMKDNCGHCEYNNNDPYRKECNPCCKLPEELK